MAAALLDHHAQGRVRVRSAGSAPGDEINPAVMAAMREVGLDLSKEFPKPLTDEFVQAADVVITMGCGDACPFYPGKRYLDWELEDPAGKARGRRAADPGRDRPPGARFARGVAGAQDVITSASFWQDGAVRDQFSVRAATSGDAAAMQAIYAPIVEQTVISFEAVAPSVAEFGERVRATTEQFPWLVAEAAAE